MKPRMTRALWLVIANVTTVVASLAMALVKLSPNTAGAFPTEQPEDAAPIMLVMRQTTIADIQQAPLFSPSRQPAPAEPPASAAAAPIVEPPNLLGIMGEGRMLRALLFDQPSNTRKLVKQREEFNGWKLLSIASKKVELQSAERVEVLVLGAPPIAPANVPPTQITQAQ